MGARACGYRGVSSKNCKGFYKSLLNAARCHEWNREAGAPRYFLSGEDLTTASGDAGGAGAQETAGAPAYGTAAGGLPVVRLPGEVTPGRLQDALATDPVARQAYQT